MCGCSICHSELARRYSSHSGLSTFFMCTTPSRVRMCRCSSVISNRSGGWSGRVGVTGHGTAAPSWFPIVYSIKSTVMPMRGTADACARGRATERRGARCGVKKDDARPPSASTTETRGMIMYGPYASSELEGRRCDRPRPTHTPRARPGVRYVPAYLRCELINLWRVLAWCGLVCLYGPQPPMYLYMWF